MISTYIKDHNLGAQPCKFTTGNSQEANNGGHYQKTWSPEVMVCKYVYQYTQVCFYVFEIMFRTGYY